MTSNAGSFGSIFTLVGSALSRWGGKHFATLAPCIAISRRRLCRDVLYLQHRARPVGTDEKKIPAL